MNIETHIRPPAIVAVAMSGGVDSSLAASLLKEQGYQVIGVTMRLWDIAVGDRSRCCSPQAFADARAVCHQLDIPHYVLDMRQTFAEKVVRPFIEEYLRGRTPNPCVLCNAEIKWKILWTKVQALGAQALATGHYARVRWHPGRSRFLLLRGRDGDKDQSYALWGLSQESLARTIFPLGGLTKAETRRLARQRRVKVADKRESQEICFVPDDDYGRFLKERQAAQAPNGSPLWSPGPIVDLQGRILGQHRGIPFYTIGQRRGLGLAAGKPLYVLDVDLQRNRLVVGDDQDLLTRDLWAENLNWISIERPTGPVHCAAQIRYGHRAASIKLFPLAKGMIRGVFLRPQRAITPGQSVVFYGQEELLGGGLIRRSAPEDRGAVRPGTTSNEVMDEN